MPDTTKGGPLSGWTVGRTIWIGSEERARQQTMIDIDGGHRPGSIGHKGQKGSHPSFPDSEDHVGTCTDVDKGGVVHMRCTCGLTWSFQSVE